VIEPTASMIADKRLLIVADGALNYIPFEALVKSTDGADYSALSYLVKTNEIVYAPSASVIAAIRGTGGNPTVRRVRARASSSSPIRFLIPAIRAPKEWRRLPLSANHADSDLALESAVNDVTGWDKRGDWVAIGAAWGDAR